MKISSTFCRIIFSVICVLFSFPVAAEERKFDFYEAAKKVRKQSEICPEKSFKSDALPLQSLEFNCQANGDVNLSYLAIIDGHFGSSHDIWAEPFDGKCSVSYQFDERLPIDDQWSCFMNAASATSVPSLALNCELGGNEDVSSCEDKQILMVHADKNFKLQDLTDTRYPRHIIFSIKIANWLHYKADFLSEHETTDFNVFCAKCSLSNFFDDTLPHKE